MPGRQHGHMGPTCSRGSGLELQFRFLTNGAPIARPGNPGEVGASERPEQLGEISLTGRPAGHL